jgi:hypothetical protein
MRSTVGAAAGVAIHLLLGGLAASATGAPPDCGDGRWQAFNCLVIGAFKDGPQTRVRLVELVDGNKPIRLQLFVLREGQPDEALPPFYGNIVWSGCMIPSTTKAITSRCLPSPSTMHDRLAAISSSRDSARPVLARPVRCLFPWAPSIAWPPGEASPRIPRQPGNSPCSSGTNAGN